MDVLKSVEVALKVDKLHKPPEGSVMSHGKQLMHNKDIENLRFAICDWRFAIGEWDPVFAICERYAKDVNLTDI